MLLLCNANCQFALLLQVRRPVQYHGNWRRGGFPNRVVDEKFLSVCGDGKSSLGINEAANAQVEQDLGRTALEGRAFSFHFYRHNFLVFGYVEQLLTIAPPCRERTTISRNLPFAARCGEALHVNLICARFVRSVCYPSAIR